jgi:hypothetical protein
VSATDANSPDGRDGDRIDGPAAARPRDGRRSGMGVVRSAPNAEPQAAEPPAPAASNKPKAKKKHHLKIEHQIRGRIRMKIPAGKGNPELLEDIKQTFGSIPGIEQVLVNPTTGSVILHYDEDRHDQFHGDLQHHLPVAHRPPTNEIDELAHKFEEEAEFLAEHSQFARGVVDFFKELDRHVKIATGNTIDLKIVLAAAIIGFTVFEVGAGAATPVWVTLVIFSLNHFVEMHPPRGTETKPAPAGA